MREDDEDDTTPEDGDEETTEAEENWVKRLNDMREDGDEEITEAEVNAWLENTDPACHPIRWIEEYRESGNRSGVKLPEARRRSRRRPRSTG